MTQLDKPTFAYLPVPEIVTRLGLYVTGTGTDVVPAGAAYPRQRHPELYDFSWTVGRILPEFQFVFIAQGHGEFESRETGLLEIKSGTLMMLFPDVWHRYRPSPGSGWTEYWISLGGDLPFQWHRRGLFSPERPLTMFSTPEVLVQQYRDIIDFVVKHPEQDAPILTARAMAIIASALEPAQASQESSDATGNAARRSSANLVTESLRVIWNNSHQQESKSFFADPTVAGALNRNGWNRFVITCIDDLISIEVNGIQTVRFRDPTDSDGFIGIQHHGEKGQTYRFRNLFIKELPIVPSERHVKLHLQEPVSIKRIDDTTTLIDFGKVAFGNITMPVPPGKGKGNVHFGEKLKGGRIDTKPPGTVRYGVTPIRLGQQRGNWVVAAPVDSRTVLQSGLMYANPPAVLTDAQWKPVMPFRWVEIEGLEEDYPYELIRRRAAWSSTWNENASSFESSDETLNRIWDLCKYSLKATTFAGVYVDGDRERIPYEADAYLNQVSHYCTDDDVKMAANTFDWLMENGTWPTEWAPHMVFMAHAEWMYSGDSDWLKHRYESLKAKTLLSRSGDDGLVRSGELDQARHDIVDWPKKERDDYVFTEVNTVVNAFHIEAMKKMASMARAIGKDQDADAFEARINLAKASLQKSLFDESAGIYRDGIGTDHSSIHANFFPLAFDLVPEQMLTGVVDWLKTKDMKCSVYAAQYFMESLFNNGSDEKAMSLILADGDRSWKHMVNSGTTISWEAWDLKYKPNQDWNHAWGAAPANLLPRFVLGAQHATAGWKTATIRPCTSGLKYARGKVPTPRGPIEIDWKSDSTFKLSLVLPAEMSAQIDLPVVEGSSGVFVDDKPVAATKKDDRWIVTDEVTGSIVLEVK